MRGRGADTLSRHRIFHKITEEREKVVGWRRSTSSSGGEKRVPHPSGHAVNSYSFVRRTKLIIFVYESIILKM